MTREAIPPAVRQALEAGHKIEAIKRLREATGMGLKEAKDWIDAHERGVAPAMMQLGGANEKAAVNLSKEAVEALKRGNTIEAIKLVRGATGTGLAEAKAIVGLARIAMTATGTAKASAPRASPTRPGDPRHLSPGQVPDNAGLGKWLVLLAVAIAVVVALLAACAVQPTAPTAEEKQSLAPTGKLRLAILPTNPSYGTKDAATGEIRGLSVDFARQVAQRLGVPLEIVPYRAISDMVASATKDEWDLVTIGINPDRQKVVDFAAPHAMSESGYLVKAAGPGSIAEVDRAGVRVVVLERGDSDIFLTQMLKNATVVRAKSQADAVAALNEGRADVHANVKTNLIPVVPQVASGRILDGYWNLQPIAFGVPRGKEASARYVKRMVDEMKASGEMKVRVAKAAVPGLNPAP